MLQGELRTEIAVAQFRFLQIAYARSRDVAAQGFEEYIVREALRERETAAFADGFHHQGDVHVHGQLDGAAFPELADVLDLRRLAFQHGTRPGDDGRVP